MINKSRRNALHQSIEGLSSWTEIHARWAKYTEKEKGDRFEDLTQSYLQIAPEYSSKLKHVWRIEEVPQAVAKGLRLPSTDKGIDLVAETHEGEYWAIQCKYRQNTDQQLTHTDISTFTSLTFQACKGFSFALVCSTTERVTSLYRDEDRIAFCALDVWQELDREFFTALRNKLTDKVVKLEPRKPRPHQIEAVKDGVEHYLKQKSARGKLIMPCGTGKSLTAWFLSQKLKSKRIVIAVPSLSLVKQTLKVWLRESVANNIDVEWICVCSDETAGRADQDDVVVQRQDIAVPCLTSTDKIADWLKTKHKGLTVVFTTYQSGDVLATAARKAKFVFDLGIMDEAHKTVGDGDKQFSILLHDHNVEISQRVFMTATERRYKGSSDKVLSMDNMEVYGDTFHQLSFKEAMECQPPILCDYNIITIGVSRQEIKELIQKNVFVRPTSGKWDEELEADMLAAMVALRKAMKEHPIKHAVSFHGSIQRAEVFQAHNDTFTKQFPEFGNLETFHVSGQTPTGTRANIIKTFAQAERSLVTNARCLTEGVDVPGIDCVLFADPRKSTVDIVQAVGRALRPSEGKKLGYVILPILHDTDATSEELIESGAFEEVLNTLRALASNDDRIIEYFRGISQGRNPSGSSRVSFEMDERIAERIDIDKLVHELEIKCWSRLAKLSWLPFEDARKFVRGLGLKSADAWFRYFTGELADMKPKPQDIPSNPNRAYKGIGWKGMGDWLGTGAKSTRGRFYLDFQDAREFARSLKLESQKEWTAYCTGKLSGVKPKPADIPSHPQRIYAGKGWNGLEDWLSAGALARRGRVYLKFKDARKFIRSLNLESQKDWRAFCKGKLAGVKPKPLDIPITPDRMYKGNGWISWGDWFGTGAIASRNRVYLKFKDARKFIHSLKFESQKDWLAYCKGELLGVKPKPDDIPACPDRAYKGIGWKGIGDWLGTGTIATRYRPYLIFRDAKKFACSLKLKSRSGWVAYCKGELPGVKPKPDDIPACPEKKYKNNGWSGWGDWLGTGTVAGFDRTYLKFEDAREFARSLKLESQKEWYAYCKGGVPGLKPKPENIPSKPNRTYKLNGWKGLGDWLGTGTVASRDRVYLKYKDARKFIHSLKFESRKDWLAYCKGELPGVKPKPDDIPACPDRAYKGIGWKGMGDWLGTGAKSTRGRFYLDFQDAREFARSLKLESQKEWYAYCKDGVPGLKPKPENIPFKPERIYADKGWKGLSDWLGSGVIPKKRKKR